MKTIVFEKHTKDVDGLLAELRSTVGPVISVASDAKRTYVYVATDSGLDLDTAVKSWEDVPELRLESITNPGKNGIPDIPADGETTHILLVQKITGYGELIPDNSKVVVTTQPPVKLSEKKFRLVDGVGSLSVGPVSEDMDVMVEVRDVRQRTSPARMLVRFSGVGVEGRDEVISDSSTEGRSRPDATDRVSLWYKAKKILGF